MSNWEGRCRMRLVRRQLSVSYANKGVGCDFSKASSEPTTCADKWRLRMDATDLHYLELTELAVRIRAREVSPVAVTRAQLDRIASLDGSLGSYALVTADLAILQAQAAEAEIAAGWHRRPLHCAPAAVKDLCWTPGIPTPARMAIYPHYRPLE